MADFEDDYVIAGASSDNFDCDSTSGWSTGGNATGFGTNTSDKKEGSASLNLEASSSGDSYWYHNVSSGSRFKITEKNLHFWFKYVKGKGDNFLVQNGTAVVIRLYFGGTSKYADYRCTSTGDLELNFGWQVLSASGSNLRGGSTGGGHNGGTDYDLDIYRIELHLNFANKNDTGVFNMDAWFIGTSVSVKKGTSSSPATMSELKTYMNSTRTAFPLVLINITGNLIDLKSKLIVGDSSTSVGYLKITNSYLHSNQLSDEVSLGVLVYSGACLQIGDKEVGSDDNYYVRGCTIVLNDDRTPESTSFVVYGDAKIYNTKIYNFKTVVFDEGASGDEIELQNVDIDTVTYVSFGTFTTAKNVDIHNTLTNSYSVVFTDVDSFSTSGLNVYRNTNGVRFNASITVNGLDITDVTGNQLVLKDSTTVNVVDSYFDDTKLSWVA